MNASVRRPAVLLRAGIFALAAAVLWWPLSMGTGVAAALLAAAGGSLAADALARRSAPSLRTASALGLALGAALLGTLLGRGLTTSTGLSRALGPVATLHASEALLAASLTLAGVFALRLLAARLPSLGALEIAAVGAAFVTSVAAHRQGMIHRPVALGDLAWSRGIDPSLVFLCLGVACVVLLASLLVSEERGWRIPLHLGVLALLAIALVSVVRLTGLPQPRGPRDLGLTRETPQETRGEGRTTRANQLEELEFRDEYPSDGNRAPVAVVLLHDDYTPPSGAYYFRQAAFSRFNGRRLVTATREDVDRDVIPFFPNARLELPWKPPAGEARRPLRTTTGLLVDHVRPFALDSPTEMSPSPRDDARFRRVFETLSLVQTLPYDALLGGRAGDPDWSDEVRDYYTELPDDPRYRELAERVVGSLGERYRDDRMARALAVKFHLDQNGIYSLKSRHSDAEDPVASFLFGDLTGYCVHFAHAAVYLMRALGVPSRVATGYAVPADDRAGGSAVMIRGVNAHAWPEIFLEDAGWVVVDLTPLQVLDQMAARPDPTLQTMLGEMLRREADRAPGEDPTRWELPELATLLRAAAALIAAALLLGFAVRLYRGLVPRWARDGELPRVAYRAALDRLAAVGVTRRFGESRERFARRADPLAPSFGPLTGAHLAAAWGGRRRLDVAALQRLSRGVGSDLGASLPRWRRVLGWLHPFNWLFAR